MQVIDTDQKIPSKAGVMLLGGTPLFPGCSMNLHIFEPRYRKMLSDALEGEWMFCIGNLTDDDGASSESFAAEIGTIGMVSAARTLEDGRSVLMLAGLKTVKFGAWDISSEYPCAEITCLERQVVPAVEEEAVKTLLMDALPVAMEEFSDELQGVVLAKLHGMKTSSAMIDFMAHHFITDTDVRSYLLGELDDKQRASKIIAELTG